MKRMMLLVLLFGTTAFTPVLMAQKTMKVLLNLSVPEGDGSNSASICWHPVQKKYYTAMAGNAIYPITIFSAAGRMIKANIDAEYDFRGTWYNTVTKRMEFNCYDSAGWGALTLDKTGNIDSKELLFEGMNQPDGQAVGFYYPPGNSVIFLNFDHEVVKYNAATGSGTGTLTKIYPGIRKKADAAAMDADMEATAWESRNGTTVVYTGMPNAELGILNVLDHQVELYSQKTGLLNSTIKIPEDVALYPNFNFSYANGYWWFFNKELRKWVGCK